jgi:hypothetical protein
MAEEEARNKTGAKSSRKLHPVEGSRASKVEAGEREPEASYVALVRA